MSVKNSYDTYKPTIETSLDFYQSFKGGAGWRCTASCHLQTIGTPANLTLDLLTEIIYINLSKMLSQGEPVAARPLHSRMTACLQALGLSGSVTGMSVTVTRWDTLLAQERT